jgi:hypothetical protein
MSFLGVMSNGRHCQFGRGSDGQQANLGVYSGTLFSDKLDVFCVQDGNTHFEATPWPMFNWMSFTLVNDGFACLDSPIPTPLLHSYV